MLTEDLRARYAPGVPYFIDAGELLVPDLLFDAAKRYPERVAIDFFSRQITYRDLVLQVRQAATLLKEAGVKAGDRVALIMPNCPQHVCAVFAVNLLGAIVVEHNPLAPSDELRQEFERHQARVVVAWENVVAKLGFLSRDTVVFGVNLAAELPPLSRTLIKLPIPALRKKKLALGAKTPSSVRSWDRRIKNAAPWSGVCSAKPDDIALLIHTGGTTGTPKAVALSHRNLCSNVTQSVAWVPELHAGAETFYAALPLFHAFGFTIAFLTGVRLGATIALFPKFDVAQVLLTQKRLPCTFFVGVPPMYERLLSGARELDVSFTSVHYAISGAMPLDADLARRWEEASGGYLVEGYGMSEASPILLGSPLSPSRRPSTLGLPFPSTEIRIVDPENPDHEIAEGEVGELLARGPQVFSGYWNDPEETAHVLHDGWLRTGDLVKVVDGFVVMADRRKELIISGGFNIYPSQVEEVVRSMPGISDVAVVGMPSGAAGEDVVAALVLEAGASVTLADVRAWAEKSIAHYALPRQIVVVQELPKSQIGKVLRRRVKEQLEEVHSGFESRFPTLSTQVSELAEKASHASSAVSEAVSEIAAEASEKLGALRTKPTKDRPGDSSKPQQQPEE